MAKADPRIDAYIAKAAAFARPILETLRGRVHAACPEVEETVKWGFPHFMYRGLLCSMAAFKGHCAFGFWNGAMRKRLDAKSKEGMGQFGRIVEVGDLPSEAAFRKLVRMAMALNAAGIKPKRVAKPKEAIEVPGDFILALKKNGAALAGFKALSYSHRKEYVQWIIEAKRAETRARRIETAVGQIAEGKSQNWKYERR